MASKNDVVVGVAPHNGIRNPTKPYCGPLSFRLTAQWVLEGTYVTRGSFASVEIVKDVTNGDGKLYALKRALGDRQVVQQQQAQSDKELQREFVVAEAIRDHPNLVLPVAYLNTREEGSGGSAVEGILYPNVSPGLHVSRYLKSVWAKENQAAGSKQAEAQMWQLLRQAADGLAHMHKCKVAHLDPNVTNLLVQENENEKATVKIIDFGLSQAMPCGQVWVGCAPNHNVYSPEQQLACSSRQRRWIDGAKCDVWHLGHSIYTVLYAVHTGFRELGPPQLFGWTAERVCSGIDKYYYDFPQDVNETIAAIELRCGPLSPDVARLLRGCFAYDASQRMSMGDVVRAIDFILLRLAGDERGLALQQACAVGREVGELARGEIGLDTAEDLRALAGRLLGAYNAAARALALHTGTGPSDLPQLPDLFAPAHAQLPPTDSTDQQQELVKALEYIVAEQADQPISNGGGEEEEEADVIEEGPLEADRRLLSSLLGPMESALSVLVRCRHTAVYDVPCALAASHVALQTLEHHVPQLLALAARCKQWLPIAEDIAIELEGAREEESCPEVSGYPEDVLAIRLFCVPASVGPCIRSLWASIGPLLDEEQPPHDNDPIGEPGRDQQPMDEPARPEGETNEQKSSANLPAELRELSTLVGGMEGALGQLAAIGLTATDDLAASLAASDAPTHALRLHAQTLLAYANTHRDYVPAASAIGRAVYHFAQQEEALSRFMAIQNRAIATPHMLLAIRILRLPAAVIPIVQMLRASITPLPRDDEWDRLQAARDTEPIRLDARDQQPMAAATGAEEGRKRPHDDAEEEAGRNVMPKKAKTAEDDGSSPAHSPHGREGKRPAEDEDDGPMKRHCAASPQPEDHIWPNAANGSPDDPPTPQSSKSRDCEPIGEGGCGQALVEIAHDGGQKRRHEESEGEGPRNRSKSSAEGIFTPRRTASPDRPEGKRPAEDQDEKPIKRHRAANDHTWEIQAAAPSLDN